MLSYSISAPGLCKSWAILWQGPEGQVGILGGGWWDEELIPLLSESNRKF